MKKKINFHIVFILVLIASIIFILYRFLHWGKQVNSDYDPTVTADELDVEVIDYIVPNMTPAEKMPEDDGITTILMLGNSPLSDDKHSEKSLSNLIAGMCDAKVYDCSVPGTLQSAYTDLADANDYPMEAFSLYWLSLLVSGIPCNIHQNAFNVMQDAVPAEALDAYDTLTSIDYDTVDVLALFYDGSDFMEGKSLYNPENPEDIRTFYGSMDSSLSLIQEAHPHIRIIVMSPAYAYWVNEDGSYEKSDFHKIDDQNYSSYVSLMERVSYLHSVTFVDNIFGTVNEGNADEYLTDNIHLNQEGRKKMAERFVYALTYFDHPHQ